MLVYLSTRESFHEDVLSGGIDDIIHDKMKQKLNLTIRIIFIVAFCISVTFIVFLFPV